MSPTQHGSTGHEESRTCSFWHKKNALSETDYHQNQDTNRQCEEQFRKWHINVNLQMSWFRVRAVFRYIFRFCACWIFGFDRDLLVRVRTQIMSEYEESKQTSHSWTLPIVNFPKILDRALNYLNLEPGDWWNSKCPSLIKAKSFATHLRSCICVERKIQARSCTKIQSNNSGEKRKF